MGCVCVRARALCVHGKHVVQFGLEFSPCVVDTLRTLNLNKCLHIKSRVFDVAFCASGLSSDSDTFNSRMFFARFFGSARNCNSLNQIKTFHGAINVPRISLQSYKVGRQTCHRWEINYFVALPFQRGANAAQRSQRYRHCKKNATELLNLWDDTADFRWRRCNQRHMYSAKTLEN